MSTDNSIENWTLLYSAELLAFSIVLILLIQSRLNKAIIIWIAANLLTIFVSQINVLFAVPSSNFSISMIVIIGNAISIVIPYYSVNFSQKLSITSIILFFAIFSAWLFCAFLAHGWIGSFISYTGGAAVVLMCAWATHKNPLWKGLRYRNVLTIGFIACAGTIFWRGTLFVSNRTGDGFLIDTASTMLGTLLILFSSILLQIGFIGVVVNHDFRERRRKDREAAEAMERSRGMAEQQRVMETVAEERLDMISLLTHEVRQPINSAQAALQALAQETKGSAPADNEIRDALSRAQSVLDGITLSISNAILGVSLIDNKQAIATFASDLVEIVELAISDCPAEQRHRIHIHSEGTAVFSNLDPVLIRLALRNLLDNALKYSPTNSSVHVDITQDDERLGASTKVSSQIKDASGLNDDMFGHRVRGGKVDVEGSGHGLYLVDKVAAAHGGTITYEITGEKYVTFDLFIPD
jgi:signal transduction histidine kinase